MSKFQSIFSIKANVSKGPHLNTISDESNGFKSRFNPKSMKLDLPSNSMVENSDLKIPLPQNNQDAGISL